MQLRPTLHARQRSVERNIPLSYIPKIERVTRPVEIRPGIFRHETKNMGFIRGGGLVITVYRPKSLPGTVR